MDQPDAASGMTSIFDGEGPGHQACERPAPCRLCSAEHPNMRAPCPDRPRGDLGAERRILAHCRRSAPVTNCDPIPDLVPNLARVAWVIDQPCEPPDLPVLGVSGTRYATGRLWCG